jgi:competence ComEA-like helix-hairpin-helix protein
MPIKEKQLEGIIVLLVLTGMGCLTEHYYSFFHQYSRTIIGYKNVVQDTIAVEITSKQQDVNGIYFLPKNAKVLDALEASGIVIAKSDKREILDVALVNGDMLDLDSQDDLMILEMSAAKKLILEIPFDLNQASSKDLTLIPGIGEVTAKRIVAFRRSYGRFNKLEDIMNVSGIKKKKLDKIEKHLCVECGRENRT